MARPRKFQPTWYATAAILAHDGLPDTQIAACLGITEKTFQRARDKDPVLQDALSQGRQSREYGNEETLAEYIFDRLPTNLQTLWKDVEECSTEKDADGVERLFRSWPVRVRQHLFIYALVSSTFNISASLRKLGLTYRMYEDWRTNDPGFKKLLQEVEEHKCNFFENAFIGRVAAGDTAAILHGVKTQCRSRGYNEKVEIVHSGSISSPDTVSIADLDLDIETRKKVLDALRAKQTTDQQAKAQAVAEVVATP